MKRSALTLAMLSCGVAAAAEDIPSSWAKFQVSDRKDDKAIVAKIQKNEWWKNCAAWGSEARKKPQTRRMWALQYFLNEQRFINGVDLGNVTGKVPEVGMTTCGALAVLGIPERVNVSKGSYGAHTQYVWRSKQVYVYTKSKTDDGNALVSSVQY